MTELTDQEVAMVLLLHPIIEGVGSNGYCRWQSDSLCPHYAFTVYAVQQLQPFLAAARAEGARDMRGKIEELADDFHDRSQSHAWPTPSSMAYRDAWRTASTVLRALLADGGEPNG